MSEWKPGDMAMVRCWDDTWRPAQYDQVLARGIWRFHDATALGADISETHPLVTIDPEDAEQVERLHAIVYALAGTDPSDRPATWQFADALREFARPTPRIEEPTGLGGLIRDEHDQLWTRAMWGWVCLTDDMLPVAQWANFESVTLVPEADS